MAKVGAKEKQIHDLRSLPRHHQLMVEDGCPPQCLRTGPGPKKTRTTKPDPGVTLAPPLSVQKAIAADLAESKTEDQPAPADAAAQPQESDVERKAKKTSTKKTANAKARTPVKAKTTSARPDGLREGSKQAIMLDMVLAGEGATEKSICKKLGWKKCRVTLKRVADKVGAKLEHKKNKAEETVWFATMKKSA